ncbi:MAG: ABC transporter permease [Mesorhizobium sp.]|nr:ABC transporter permease [Mesorhizobium sp.]MBL8575581.1 ABC transporter permease [Mesorhizobium sp.]
MTIDHTSSPTTSLAETKEKHGPFAALSSLRELVLLPVIAALIVFGAFMHPAFLTWNNMLSNVMGSVSVLAIMVVAQSLLIIAGKFDLSTQSTVGFAPMLAAYLVVSPDLGGAGVELHPLLGVAVLFAVGIVIGMFNGFLVAKLKLNAFIVTLAMLILLQGLTLGVSGGRTISNLPGAFTFLGLTSFLGIRLEVWIALAVIFGAAYVMRYTVVGRHIYAIGGNVEAARAAGVRVERVIFGLFVLAGILAALAGFVLTSRIASVSASQGNNLIFTVFAAAVIGGIDLNGGRGRIIGAATGVLLLAIIQNLLVLLEVPSFWVSAIYGAVILVSMMIGAITNSLGVILAKLASYLSKAPRPGSP